MASVAAPHHPLTPSDVLKGTSPLSPSPQKGVVLVDEPDEIIPPPIYDDDDRPDSARQHKASISGKKLTGRPPLPQDSSSSLAIPRKSSSVNLSNPDFFDSSSFDSSTTDAKRILTQVAEWLQDEKAKATRKKKPKRQAPRKPTAEDAADDDAQSESGPERGDDGLDLSTLENILAGYMKSSAGSTPRLLPKSPNLLSRRGSLAKKFKRPSAPPQSSDTEFFGEDILVPNVEADLDNTKTLAYSGGTADEGSEKLKKKDQKHWKSFKKDILRLTHTLKLKGWRRISMEDSPELEVSRLSGALTNAVYVVKPPKKVPEEKSDGKLSTGPKRRPLQLLLRIYGPQADHLINRDDELAILRRLARKRIGPRLLGTFSNGRFEEFLHARTLEAADLRIPETSKQIAKRMRELHEGIELLPSEIEKGPAIFVNWDKCIDRCEKVITWLDEQVRQAESGCGPHAKEQYTRYGLICGVEWPVFRQVYEKYRQKLIKEECGGEAGLREKLLFAHNDTQYGNLMRLTPSGESPLLHPVNQHKQLVVIDFEYAGQNTAGLEFANHFTEWCYNYHHPERSWACNTNIYPTIEEQRRFIRSYVMHRPQFNPSASATPHMEARDKTNISDFMLDARAASGAPAVDYDAEEKEREKAQEEEIEKLMQETRLWRIANTAHWVCWGIVQAPIPELAEPKSKTAAVIDKIKDTLHPQSDSLTEEEKKNKEAAKHDRPEGREQEEAHGEGDEEQHEEFDYLAYAQDRAMFFWGDCLQMGLIREDELPEKLRKMVRIVPY